MKQMLILNLKIQTVAHGLPQQLLLQQSKDYYYDQTTAVIIKITVKWTMPVLLNHVHE